MNKVKAQEPPRTRPVRVADSADSKNAVASGAHRREKGSRKKKQTDWLLELADRVELFHTPEGEPYADIRQDGHFETHAVKSRRFRQWLGGEYFQFEGRPARDQDLKDAVETFAAKALHEGEELPVFVRIARHGPRIYVDLGDPKWRAIKIDASGWRIVTTPTVRFRRPRGTLPLPVPTRGGSIDELRPFLNLASADDFVLLVGVIVGAFHPEGPYYVLELVGAQGSAKSTVAKVVKRLIDPSTPATRPKPRDERDLMIGANNRWCLVLDNLSRLPEWLSDALCRLSTGGGFATRQLYSDGEEFLIDVKRPTVLTGIEELAVRGDLLDRTITICCPPITSDKRRPEQEFWDAFDTAIPRLLGAILSAVSAALRESSNIRLRELPRMADMACWITAAESALDWPPGSFLRSLDENQRHAHQRVVESSLVATLITELVDDGNWVGTASELLADLTELDNGQRGQRRLPTDPGHLGSALRRVAPNLEALGITVTPGRTGRKGTRLLSIRRHQNQRQDRQHRQRVR